MLIKTQNGEDVRCKHICQTPISTQQSDSSDPRKLEKKNISKKFTAHKCHFVPTDKLLCSKILAKSYQALTMRFRVDVVFRLYPGPRRL